MQLWGANIILPFKTGNWLDSRLTVAGMQMRQRCDDFFDIPFNRKKWMFCAMLNIYWLCTGKGDMLNYKEKEKEYKEIMTLISKLQNAVKKMNIRGNNEKM